MIQHALAELASITPNGWLLGACCWMVLRLIGRMDALEKEQAETREALDALHGTLRAIEARMQ